VNTEIPSRIELYERSVISSHQFVLAVLHGVTEDLEVTKMGIKVLIRSLHKMSTPIIWIGSNNDTLGIYIENIVKTSLRVNDKFYANLNRLDYLSLLKNCDFIIGNSSSGILEAPTFSKPTINIGRRQIDRLRGTNVLDCEFSENEIDTAIATAMSAEFRDKCISSTNPYGEGDSSEKILNILESTKITHEFLVKQITY
jgi:UDP-N-acetylglucosamine 2-epimerase